MTIINKLMFKHLNPNSCGLKYYQFTNFIKREALTYHKINSIGIFIVQTFKNIQYGK